MKYVHEEYVNEQLVRHWANESESAEDKTATYCIKQVETGAIYSEAVDVVPCRYTYEETDEPIAEEDATVEDYEAALEVFGV